MNNRPIVPERLKRQLEDLVSGRTIEIYTKLLQSAHHYVPTADYYRTEYGLINSNDQVDCSGTIYKFQIPMSIEDLFIDRRNDEYKHIYELEKKSHELNELKRSLDNIKKALGENL